MAKGTIFSNPEINPLYNQYYKNHHNKYKFKNTFSQQNDVVIENLKSEISILTSCGNDTIYRFSYTNMKYDYISNSVTKLLGYAPDYILSNNGLSSLIIQSKFTHNTQSSYLLELESKRLENKNNKWQAKYLVRTKDNKTIWITDTAYPLKNEQGEVTGCVGCLREVIDDYSDLEGFSKEELIDLINTDHLTSLANRRKFFNILDFEVKRIKRNNSYLSILLIDIDFFKNINDKYGHTAGDKILIEIGERIKSYLRETDLVARLGGEEFGVFLPDTCHEGAHIVAERICKTIANHKFYIDEELYPINCTISVGVSTSHCSNFKDTQSLYKDADQNLYKAKNAGRNKVKANIKVIKEDNVLIF